MKFIPNTCSDITFYDHDHIPWGQWAKTNGKCFSLDKCFSVDKYINDSYCYKPLLYCRRSPLKGRKPKALIGCLFDKLLFDHLESSTLENGNCDKEFCKAVTSYDCEARFTVGVQISGLRRLSTELWLQKGDFEPKMIPEHIRDVWGPFMLEKLPRGVSNQCLFALHKWVELYLTILDK